MTTLIILFGILIAAMGFLLLFRPAMVLGIMESSGEKLWLYLVAVGARVVLGLLLLLASEQSKYPLVIEVLGWIALAAAVFLALLGPKRLGRLVRWIVDKVKPFAPIGGLIAVAFGAFLVWAFV